MTKSATARAARKPATPRAPAAPAVDLHAAIYAAETAIVRGEHTSQEAFASLCKATEKAFPREATPAAQEAFKAEWALDIFAARAGIAYTSADATHDAARVLLAAFKGKLEKKPARKDFESDASFEAALAVYRAYGAAKSRKARVFGAAGAAHWEKPLKDGEGREKANRAPRAGASEGEGEGEGEGATGFAPSKTVLFASDEEAALFAGEVSNWLLRLASANKKRKGFGAFAVAVEAAVLAHLPA